MSVILLPGIVNLDPDSLCYSIYNQLYNNFFNAQDKKDEQHPWGVEEGDETSIRLRNTAYNFAEAIAGAVNGEGGSGENGGVLLNYIHKKGDQMQGKLLSNYGFEAGVENHCILQTGYKEYRDDNGNLTDKRYNVQINGDLDVGSGNLFIGGKNFIGYDFKNDWAVIEYNTLYIGKSLLKSSGSFELSDGFNTVTISSTSITVNGNDVYHKGNANSITIDWVMKNAHIENDMRIRGKANFEGFLSAINGFELGCNNNTYIYADQNKINLKKDLNFETVNGIKMQDYAVLSAISNTDIHLSAVYGYLILGLNNTDKIVLGANVSDIDNQYVLISKFGAAYFPDSLTVRHNFGDVLLSTYRKDSTDEGIVIHKKIRFGDKTGPWIESQGASIVYSSNLIDYDNYNERYIYTYSTSLNYLRSQSYYRPQDQLAHSIYFTTDAHSFIFNRAVESHSSIGIINSPTKLSNGQLFFNEDNFLLSSAAGIKYYGHAFMMSGISSERFASGFAGYGWAILPNLTTGNIAATFDELTVRKKMRIYELEVQKITATNGSLWVSDNCSGDTVIKL